MKVKMTVMESILISWMIEFLSGNRDSWNTEYELYKNVSDFLKSKDCSFRSIDDYKTQLSDKTKRELKKYKEIDNNDERKSYRFETKENLIIYQPFGSQRSPDILIISNHCAFFLEHKSSNNGSIMWNSSYPIFGGCYVYHNSKENYSTFFSYNVIISDTHVLVFDKFSDDHKKLVDKYKHLMPDNIWGLFSRNMFTTNVKFGLKYKSADLLREQSSLKYIREMF